MGASGGGQWSTRSASSISHAFRTAIDEQTRTTQARDPSRTRNVFISFHNEDKAQVELLRAQAANPNFELDFRDYSIKEPFDEAWRANCRERISLTSATIVMIGPETASRPAVLWEIEESYRQGHKVIGVRIYKSERHEVPRVMRDHDAPIVDWNRDAIRAQLDSN